MSTLVVSVGSTIADRYEVRALVGRGGMGSVYRVHDRELDEDVALKVLRPELAATPEALVRFRREVKLARRVTHPNVARTYDLGEHAGTRYLTMELITGERLRGPMPIPDVLRVAGEISQGLAAAHAVGVVHRDLKPENILLAADRVVLTDFGIAHSADPADAMRTTASVMGTPAYIAPEQLEAASIDGRTDVYALGVVLYELIAGRLPFDGDSVGAIMLARLTRAPVPLRGPAIPEGVARLVMEALARRKEDRPDAHMLSARIARLRGGGAGPVTIRPAREQASMPAIAIETLVVSSRRTVNVARLDADPATLGLAGDLATAIADALVAEPAIRVVREGAADETVELTVRASPDRIRVRLRILDGRGEAIWAERLEGPPADPFALEDATAALVTTALKARAGRASGPEGAIRERYDEARRTLRMGPQQSKAAIEILEELLREDPDNVWVASLLAVGLIRKAFQTGADDAAAFARAEELALRAVERDPTNGQGYYAIAAIRSLRGEHAESIAAALQAQRRAPLLFEPHLLIGRAMCWCGRVAEGLQSLELASRLETDGVDAAGEKLRVYGLIGDREGARRELARLEAQHAYGAIIGRLRLIAWWEDKELARDTAELIVRNASGGAADSAGPAVAAYARGDLATLRERLVVTMGALASERVLPRQRAFMHEVAVEMFMLAGARDDAMQHLEALGQISTFIDLLWLDRCPNLAPLREGALFAQTRAVVAERAARLFE